MTQLIAVLALTASIVALLLASMTYVVVLRWTRYLTTTIRGDHESAGGMTRAHARGPGPQPLGSLRPRGGPPR